MSNHKKILITGASGFIGRALVNDLAQKGRRVIALSRNFNENTVNSNVEPMAVDDLASFNDSKRLEGVDSIVHLAGVAHFKSRKRLQLEAALMRANKDTTYSLAKTAARAGVRRFVLLSSIGVLGNTSRDIVFDDNTPVAPHNAYTRSKLAAEQALWKVVQNSQIEGVVLRSPLVYGPGTKGSLASLLVLLRRGLPLPFGAIHNRRSLIGLGNLIDLIKHCVEKPEAAGKTYVVSDREVISTTDLVRRLAAVTNSKAILIPLPVSLIYLAACLIGKTRMAEQLTGNLEIDSSRVRTELDWEQPFTFEQGTANLGSDFDKDS